MWLAHHRRLQSGSNLILPEVSLQNGRGIMFRSASRLAGDLGPLWENSSGCAGVTNKALCNKRALAGSLKPRHFLDACVRLHTLKLRMDLLTLARMFHPGINSRVKRKFLQECISCRSPKTAISMRLQCYNLQDDVWLQIAMRKLSVEQV